MSMMNFLTQTEPDSPWPGERLRNEDQAIEGQTDFDAAILLGQQVERRLFKIQTTTLLARASA